MSRTWTNRIASWCWVGVCLFLLGIGAPVPVLVDPAHPKTVFTVHDVEVDTNAGWSVLAFFGVALAMLCTAGLGAYWWFIGRLVRGLRVRHV
jgi:hypothetical protein